VTTLEIAAGGGALVGLWVLLLIASWLEDLIGPAVHREALPGWNAPVEGFTWDVPVTRTTVPVEPTIAASTAAEAA
jgi:hypothetical protein